VAARSSNPTPRLLVVDDEEGLLFLMTDALRREGYEVEGFDSGARALEWLVRETPDLLVLDLKLGDVSAPKLLERLGEKGRQFPFIIVTGHGDERTAVEMMKRGALDYVMKDAGMLELLPSIVRRALSVIERERRLAEATEAVRLREERQRTIIQTALDGFVRFDARWRLIEVNGALCDLLGFSTEELLHTSLFDIKAMLVPEEFQNRLSRIHKGFVRFFTRLKRYDETLFDVEVSLRADGDEIFGFVHDVSEQRRLEREVLQIGEEERHRFGCELHDNLGQQLTALDLMSATLARELKTIAPTQAKSANDIAEHARKLIAQTRQLAHGLAPVTLEAEGLRAALSDLARATAATGIPCKFECVASSDLPDLATATHLYRIAQEAVNNALRHARASRIILRLTNHDGSIELSIRDNGRGLAASHARKQGMGLRVIHHRARLIGAQLHVYSKPKGGVRVVCTLPKQP